MDKATMVRSDLEVRGKVLGALSLARVPVTLVELDYIPGLEEWQVFVATPLYDTKGPAEAVSRVLKAFQSMGIYKELPIRRVSISSPEELPIKELDAEVKRKTEGEIYIFPVHRGHKGQYMVVFAPFTGPGGAVPSRRFNSQDHLQRFLEDEIGISRSSVEDALRELDRKGSASIFQVQMTRREAKRVGLA
jgi:hypothetical protein